MNATIASVSAVLTALSTALAAQQWQVVSPQDVYLYRHSDSTVFSHQISVDSIQNNRLCLNRVTTDCRDCPDPAKRYNQGQFLQKTIRATPEGGFYLEGKDTLLLFPTASPGQSWMFDLSKNISAQVESVAATAVLGVTDSVKTIRLSNGQILIIGKNSGVIQFPDRTASGYFHLVGIPTRNLGDKMPDVYDFFDFSPGDVFERYTYSSLDAGTPSYRTQRVKARILDKFWENDTLVYQVEQKTAVELFWSVMHPFFGKGADTAFWRVHPSFFSEWVNKSYPAQYVEWPESINGYQASTVRFMHHPEYGFTKVLGEMGPFFTHRCGLFERYTPGAGETLNCDGCFAFHRAYAVGLGLVSIETSCFEVFETTQLVGFVKNGDTTGLISPDKVFTSVREPLPLTFYISPNPATDHWNMFFPSDLTEAIEIRVYSAAGRLEQTLKAPPGAQSVRIETTFLPSGLYYIQAQGKYKRGFARAMRL